MATLGKTTSPSWPTFGWIDTTAFTVAELYTMPAPGGIFRSVTFWAASHGAGSQKIFGVIMDSSGNLLARGPGVFTSGGVAVDGNVGSSQWYTDTLQSPLFVAAGTQIYIGWCPNSSSVAVDWAYNGNDHSPNARWKNTGGGTPTGAFFSGHSQMSPAGAVAVYGTYDPAGGYVMRSGVWTPGEADDRRSGVNLAGASAVRRSGAWQSGS